jgi:hypothetical protein
MPAGKSKPQPKAGRPKYEATDVGKRMVASMVIADIDQDTIALCVGISRPTLRRAYRRELDSSYAIIMADIATKVVSSARNGDQKAQFFYLETHGWLRGQAVQQLDKNGKPADSSLPKRVIVEFVGDPAEPIEAREARATGSRLPAAVLRDIEFVG